MLHQILEEQEHLKDQSFLEQLVQQRLDLIQKQVVIIPLQVVITLTLKVDLQQHQEIILTLKVDLQQHQESIHMLKVYKQ